MTLLHSVIPHEHHGSSEEIHACGIEHEHGNHDHIHYDTLEHEHEDVLCMLFCEHNHSHPCHPEFLEGYTEKQSEVSGKTIVEFDVVVHHSCVFSGDETFLCSFKERKYYSPILLQKLLRGPPQVS